jgi:hypothetical protein
MIGFTPRTEEVTPLYLLPEAEADMLRWEAALSTMKGKERMQGIEAYVSRYNQIPHLPQPKMYHHFRQAKDEKQKAIL